MADSTRYMDWYKKAEKDLAGAKILFEHDGDNSLVAFHCQQAMEKMLKGYILKHSKRLLDGHSLIFLIRKALVFDDKIDIFSKSCAFVNQFYIETRYPADICDPVDNTEAGEAIDAAKKLCNYILSDKK